MSNPTKSGRPTSSASSGSVWSGDQATLAAFLGLLGLMGCLWLHVARPEDPRRISPRPLEYRVNLNSADAATLDLLPGLGPTLSQRIVQHREIFGPFQGSQDLQRVRGIGPVTRRKLEPWVRFDEAE